MSFINPTNWRGAMQSTSAAIDAAMGEMLRIIPVDRKPNHQGTAQEEQAIVVRGVFTTHATLGLSDHSFGHQRSTDVIVETRKPIFSFARAQLPWGLQRGDRIQRCCNPEEIYEATRIESDVTSQRITVHVVQLGRMEQ